jgi:polyisoprenoid-binding protein YceI
LTSATETTHAYTLDASHSTVEFIVRHLMISKVRGRFTAVAGTIKVPAGSDVPTELDVTLETASIDTRDEQRDGHLKSPDFFDAATFPNITFRSTSVEGSSDAIRVTGDLTMHGVTKPVTLEATFEGRATDPYGNARIGYEAHGKISRKDFGLVWNMALETGGVAISDEVKIELNVEALAPKYARDPA